MIIVPNIYGDILLPPWAYAIIFAVAALIVTLFVIEFENARAKDAAEYERFAAYMRECVPKHPERRCRELYRWTVRQ